MVIWDYSSKNKLIVMVDAIVLFNGIHLNFVNTPSPKKKELYLHISISNRKKSMDKFHLVAEHITNNNFYSNIYDEIVINSNKILNLLSEQNTFIYGI